jgi:hypothetical protein
MGSVLHRTQASNDVKIHRSGHSPTAPPWRGGRSTGGARNRRWSAWRRGWQIPIAFNRDAGSDGA